MNTWYEELKFDTNPLDTRPNSNLVGLDKETEKLKNHILKEELCFLNGLTGSGKTSLLLKIQNELKRYKFIYLDAQDLPPDFNLEQELKKKRSFFDKITFKQFPRKKPVLLIDEFQSTNPNLILEARGKWESQDRKIKSIVITQISKYLNNVSDSFKDRLGNRIMTLKPIDDFDMRKVLKNRLYNKKTKIIKKEQKKPIKELKPPKKKIKEIKIIKKLKKVVRIRRKPEGKYFKPIPKIKPKIKKKVKIKKRISRIKLKKPVRKIRKPLKKVQKKPEIKAEEKVEKKGLFGRLKEKVAKKLAQQGELFIKTEKLPSLKFGNIITKRMDQITLKDIISHLSLYKKPISYEVINRYMYLTKEQWEKFKELNKGVFQ